MTVSGGYPGDYKTNVPISGLGNLQMENGSMVFHAGTKQTDGEVVTNGGRVLAVTANGNSIKEAVEKSKKVLAQISFEGMNFRHDIGFEFK